MNLQEALQQIQIAEPKEKSEKHEQLNSFPKQEPQYNDLMTSIENKLSMLACDDSISNFEASKISSPKRQYLTATDEKRKHPRMFLHDLETSQRNNCQLGNRQSNCGKSVLGESRIVGRINQMEHFYMQKIQMLSHQISSLQFDNEQLYKKYQQLQKANKSCYHILQLKQNQQMLEIDKKVAVIKTQLVSKFSNQAEEHFQKHLKQMKNLTNQLTEQKNKRRALQQEVKLLRTEKSNLQNFYKDLLHDHKEMIKVDLHKGLQYQYENRGKKQEDRSQQQYCKITEKEVQIYQNGNKIQISPEQKSAETKKKSSKSSEKKKKKNSRSSINLEQKQTMTQQEMIPYLAQGIKDLKNKLHIK